MGIGHVKMLGLVLTMGAWTCYAQDAPVPFGQIEHDALIASTHSLPDGTFFENSFSTSLSMGGAPAEPLAGGFSRAPAVRIQHSIGSSFYLFNGLHLATAALDVELTHRCIETHQCREVNPLMPSNLAGALSVNFAFVGYGSYLSYHLKKHDAHRWWLSPAIGTAGHIVGIGTGIAHQ
jgi:hypothetical protein